MTTRTCPDGHAMHPTIRGRWVCETCKVAHHRARQRTYAARRAAGHSPTVRPPDDLSPHQIDAVIAAAAAHIADQRRRGRPPARYTIDPWERR